MVTSHKRLVSRNRVVRKGGHWGGSVLVEIGRSGEAFLKHTVTVERV